MMQLCSVTGILYCSVLWWLFPHLFACVLVAWNTSSIHLKNVTIEFYASFTFLLFLLNSCSIHSLIFFPLHCLLYYFGEINTFYLTVYLSIFLAKWASSTISAFPRLSQRHAMPFSYEHWSSVPCTLCLLNLLIIFIGKSFYSQNSKKYLILYTGELFPTLCYVCVCS